MYYRKSVNYRLSTLARDQTENVQHIYNALNKVCNYRARRRPANHEQAKKALTPVIIIQLAPC